MSHPRTLRDRFASPRYVSCVLLIAFASFAATLCSPVQAESEDPDRAASRPNVVFLLSDDLGYRDIGCYGGPAQTTTLDALAENGVLFTDFHSGAAVCSPSRATTLTGRQHLRAGVYSWIDDYAQASHFPAEEVSGTGIVDSLTGELDATLIGAGGSSAITYTFVPTGSYSVAEIAYMPNTPVATTP
ncbi:MAG: sulfatase-like hydrolase/transferase, partial [Planctomycetota bacterium]